jgi:uncharacterized Fe-S cluster-containing radical SAM superfamily enzyme
MPYITVKVVAYDEQKGSLICVMEGRGVVRVRMVSQIPPYVGEEVKVEYWRTTASGMPAYTVYHSMEGLEAALGLVMLQDSA